jgi:hypothetical protein
MCLESAPVPRALEALGEATNASVLGALCACGRLNRFRRRQLADFRALAVGAAGTQVLPFAIRAMATIAGPMQETLGMEAGKLVEPDLVGRVLPAEDAATFSTVMTALEEAKRFLARRRGAYRSGSVGLKRVVSTIGLEFSTRMCLATKRTRPCIG